MIRDLSRTSVVQGLFRLWVVLTGIWLVVVAFLVGRSAEPASAFLPLALWPPLMLLIGAIATVWVVRGFKG